MGASLRRAVPLLGTLVRIHASGADRNRLERATDAAMSRVARVHAAMSFHDADSDVRALARASAGDVVRVTHDTSAVLRIAMQMEAASGGAFNACRAAVRLVQAGLLPAPRDANNACASTLCAAIQFEADDAVRVRHTPWIDLGGIAKGYAVDAAVQALREAEIGRGVVDAGGDLRAFGEPGTTVHVRDPRQPALAIPVAEIRDLACATSAWSSSSPRATGAPHLIGDGSAQAEPAVASVSVFAPSCMAADALTKVVWLLGTRATDLLAAHAACAWLLRPDGSSRTLGGPADVG